MATVSIYQDIVEGASASHHITQGWTIARVAIVEGLNPNNTFDTPQLLAAAEAAVVAITGPRRSPCPNIPVGTYLETFEHEPLSAHIVRTRIVYRGYPLATYEFDGALEEVESNLDVNGQPITLSYTYPRIYRPDQTKNNWTDTIGVMVSRIVPESIFTIRWIVTGMLVGGVQANATDVMSWWKQSYEGKLNQEPWGVGIIIGGPRTWRCDKLSGTSKDAGLVYEAAMTVHYKPQTWDKLIVYKAPETGLPPPDLIAGVGYKRVQNYEVVPFPYFNFQGN